VSDPQDFDPSKPWEPDQGPSQRKAFHDSTPMLLLEGMKGSGKTNVALDKVVRHQVENPNALSLIISPTAAGGKLGVLDELERIVLPKWKYGNRDYTGGQFGPLLDRGIGLQFTDPKEDSKTKDMTLRVRSLHEQSTNPDKWGKVVFKSIPHAHLVKERIYAISPSQVMVDEITNTSGPEYLTHPAAQLGRRAGIAGVQQFIGTCNPAGPSHWVYDRWHRIPFDEDGKYKDKASRNYRFIFIPVTENVHRMPPGYAENLEAIFSSNRVEYQRMVEGLWVDMQDGNSIFVDSYVDELHVMGDAGKGTGIIPLKGHTVYVGMDPGVANFCASFLQRVNVGDSYVWLQFDELNYVGKRTPYDKVCADMADVLDYWSEKVGEELPCRFIADADAFTRRNTSGGFEAAEIESHINNRITSRGLSIRRARLEKCPKGKGSVATRVRILQDLLIQERYLLSAMCPKTRDMFMYLKSKLPKEGVYSPDDGFLPMRSPQLHQFDSTTYPILKIENSVVSTSTGSVTPRVYACGGSR
jgi:hypothetical protein